MPRLNHHEYFLKVVEAVSLRSSCDRGRAGAVITKENRIIATGYAGSPIGAPHCDDVGHELEKQGASLHCIRSVHAEENAILQAARYGPSIDGATLFCTMFPCYSCAKSIVNAGIKNVIVIYDYKKSRRSKELFTQAKIQWSIIKNTVLSYDA